MDGPPLHLTKRKEGIPMAFMSISAGFCQPMPRNPRIYARRIGSEGGMIRGMKSCVPSATPYLPIGLSWPIRCAVPRCRAASNILFVIPVCVERNDECQLKNKNDAENQVGKEDER
jgi:hypothetical protein